MTSVHPVKKNISLLFRALRKKRLLPGPSPDGFRVLLYHAVGPDPGGDTLGLRVTEQVFYRQMAFLKKEDYRVLRISELISCLVDNKAIGHRSLGISFDDGYKDILTNALPILERFGFPATVFVRTDALGGLKKKVGYWDSWEYLSAVGLKELIGSGMIDIGSHTMTHRNLTLLEKHDLEKEIAGSRSLLEGLIGRPVDLFSYPFGRLNRRAKRISDGSGYRAAFSSFIGINEHGDDRFELKRTEIASSDGLAGLQMKLDGEYDWLYYLQKMRKCGLI